MSLDRIERAHFKGLGNPLDMYKILFYFEAYVHESILFFANSLCVSVPPPPPFISHTTAQHSVPLDPLYCNIYHTIL